jgi:hypothetical protein
MKVAELEADFAEMDGWMAESNAAELLSNSGCSRRPSPRFDERNRCESKGESAI